MFLYRHGTSLACAESFGLLLGYGKGVVAKALDSLGVLGLKLHPYFEPCSYASGKAAGDVKDSGRP
jgi:hypothetical protein